MADIPPVRLSQAALNRLLRESLEAMFKHVSDHPAYWRESKDGMYIGYAAVLTRDKPFTEADAPDELAALACCLSAGRLGSSGTVTASNSTVYFGASPLG